MRRSVSALSALFILQASIYYGVSRREFIPDSTALREFPRTIQGWTTVEDRALDPALQKVLRADDSLFRVYAAAPNQTASLFVAFFKSQRAGQTPHSPKNCLPGSGWMPLASGTLDIPIPGRTSSISVNRYLVAKGDQRAVVFYWYQSRDRVTANEYTAAAFTAWDALRYSRTDTALVRVVVQFGEGDSSGATATAMSFIQVFFQVLRGILPG